MKRRSIIPIALTVAIISLMVAPAGAITYGVPDGDGHPNVGALVAERTPGQKGLVCSGTLIAPTVFLTASHCTAYLESLGISEVWVTFDSQFSSKSKLILGTMHTNPGYNQSQSDPGDIAVITFEKAVKGIKPASLPPAGLFDRMAEKNGLKGQTFTAVGYGRQEATFGGGPPEFGPSGTRMVSISTFDALNGAWLHLSQNPATDDGGTCYGDSGGPNFLDDTDVVAALTVTGDSMCRATNVDYRLDTPSARAFLANFVTLP